MLRKPSTIAARLKMNRKPDRIKKKKRTRRPSFENLEARRLLAVDWRNPADNLDVNGDLLITALDALQVINEVNRRGGEADLTEPYAVDKPYVDVNGSGSVTPLDALDVINALNRGVIGDRKLAESEKFSAEMSTVITVGQESGIRTYRMEVDASFGMSSGAINDDLFAVYLVDPSDESVSLIGDPHARTPLFSLSSEGARVQPGISRWDGTMLELDLSSVVEKDSGQLLLQSLNRNGVTDTSIRVRLLENLVLTSSAKINVVDRSATAVTGGESIATSAFSETPAVIRERAANYDSHSGVLSVELAVRNPVSSMGRNAVIAFPNLPQGVSLENASGVTDEQVPYVSLRPAISSGGLAQNTESQFVVAQFKNESGQAFTIDTLVLAGQLNQPPSIAPINDIDVVPGDVVLIPITVTDADEDRVTLSIASDAPLPTGKLLGRSGFEIRPTPDDVGNYSFQLLASDGESETRRDVHINVVEDPIKTTRVVGRVLDVDLQPIVGLKVELGTLTAITSNDGSFSIDAGTGPLASQTVRFRGDLITGTKTYPFVAEKLSLLLGREVYDGRLNQIDRPVYLPALNVGTAIDSTQDTMAMRQLNTNEAPVEVLVKANTLFDQQGQPFTGALSITEVPRDLTPAALPKDFIVDVVVTIQPGEMSFSSPAPISFPNRSAWPPHTQMDLYSIDPVSGEFVDVGDMVVSEDGGQVGTVSGGIRNSSWHFFVPTIAQPSFVPPSSTDTETCPPCRATAGNFEVDLQRGSVYTDRNLVGYSAGGESITFGLQYDSFRADPRPIVQSGFRFLDIGAVQFDPRRFSTPPSVLADFSPYRLTAKLNVNIDGLLVEQPGFEGTNEFLRQGERVWKVEGSGVSLTPFQVDLSNQPTGKYQYEIETSVFNGPNGGARSTSEGSIYNINFRDSEFGAGWGIAELWELAEDDEGAVFVWNGQGESLLFTPRGEEIPVDVPPFDPDLPLPPVGFGQIVQRYDPPEGDFSILLKDDLGQFHRWLPDDSLHRFGENNRIAELQSDYHHTLTFSYDQDNVLASISDSTGLETIFRSVNGRIAEIEHPGQRITLFEIDGVGNLLSVTDPDGTKTQYDYDSQHRLTQETDKRGQSERMVYSDVGRAERGIRKDGSVQFYNPTQAALLSSIESLTNPDAPIFAPRLEEIAATYIDGNGNAFETALDPVGQRTGGADSVGILPSVERTNNLITKSTDSRGNETQILYDTFGSVSETTVPISRAELITQSSLGKEFWLAIPPTDQEELTIQISVTANEDGVGRVSAPATDFMQTFSLLEGETTEVEIPMDFITKNDSIEPLGLLVSTDVNANVVALLTSPSSGNAAAFSIQSTKALGRNYVTLGAPNAVNNGSYFSIVATEDNTVVDYLLPIATFGFPAREKLSVTLNRGETYLLSNIERQGSSSSAPDLSGTEISSSKPIAVFSGHYCANVTAAIGFCDQIVEQVPPIESWGVEFIAAPIGGRDVESYYRVITPYDDTIVLFNGERKRESDRYFSSADIVRIEATKPILIAQYAPGLEAGGDTGDPFMIFLTPLSLMQNEYLIPATPDEFESHFVSITSDNNLNSVLVNGIPISSDFLSTNAAGNVAVVPRTGEPLRITSEVPIAVTYYGHDQGPATGYGTNAGMAVPIGHSPLRDVATSETRYMNRAEVNGDNWEDVIVKTIYDLEANLFNFPNRLTDALGRSNLYFQDWTYDQATSYVRRGSPHTSADDRVTIFGNVDNEFGSPVGRADHNYGQPDFVVDPLERRTEYEYDQFGRIITKVMAAGTDAEATRRFEYDTAGNQTAIIDENGNRTEFEYSPNNYLTKVISPDPDGDGPLLSSVTEYHRDEEGFVRLVVDPLGVGQVIVPDELGRIVETAVHPLGNQIGFSSDETVPFMVPAYPDERALRTKNKFDAVGNLTSATDPSGNTTRYRYDARNRLISTTDADGGVTLFEYDLDNNLTALTDPVGNATRYVFGPRSEIIEEIDPLGNTTRYDYDAVGNLIRKHDRNERLTVFEYNAFDELITETWYTSANELTIQNVIHYLYDNSGNLLSVNDQFSSLTYAYDSRDRVVMVDNAGTPGAPNVVLNYTYDAYGNVLTVTDVIDGEAGATTSYTYDALHRMLSIEQSGESVSEKAVDFVYNQVGQFGEIARYSDIDRNNLVALSDYEYDELNRLTDLDHTNAADLVLAAYDYEYDPSSRISAIIENGKTTDYSYDDHDQLIGADRVDDDVRGDETYAYDNNGNRVSSSLHGNNYETGPNNRLLSDGTFDYEYDNEGNMVHRTEIESGDFRIFDWDHRNRLVRATDFASDGTATKRVDFIYDTADRRIAKSVDSDGDEREPAATAWYAHNGEDVLFVFDFETQTDRGESILSSSRYLNGPSRDHVLATEANQNEQTHWFIANHLGSITKLLDSEGMLVEYYEYDSYGGIYDIMESPNSVRFGFIGRETDEELGLTHIRARYLDNSTGRFISEDPVAPLTSESNLMRYAYNDPINFVDRTGLSAEAFTGMLTQAAISGLIEDILIDIVPYYIDKGIDYLRSQLTPEQRLKYGLSGVPQIDDREPFGPFINPDPVTPEQGQAIYDDILRRGGVSGEPLITGANVIYNGSSIEFNWVIQGQFNTVYSIGC